MRQATRKRRLALLRLATCGVVIYTVLASAPVAQGDATVSISNGRLTTSVTPRSGSDGAHGIIVEPFKESAGRDGFRVREDQTGRPPFSENAVECFGNFVFNDVVCTGPRGSAVVTGGDSGDTVAASETPGGRESLSRVPATVTAGNLTRVFQIPFIQAGSFGCVEPANAGGGLVEVNLGAGRDFVAVLASQACPVNTVVESGFLARLDADGGTGGDGLVGGPAVDVLSGGPGGDAMLGGGGDDILEGGPDDDEVRGGPGRDSVRGDGGRDFLDSFDGERDLLVDCGANNPGTVDTAFVDSADVGATTPLFLLGQGSVIRNCEFVIAGPIDDGRPGTLLGRRLRIRADGLTRVRIACRRAALVPCRGRVSVSDPKHLARVLASAPYAIRLGARKRVVLKLTAAERALLRRRGRAIVATKEQGRSRRGPRGARRTFGIAGS